MELPVKISWFTGILFFNIMGPLQAQNNTFRILNQELALKLARNANLEFLNQKIEFEYKFTSSSAPGEHQSELNNRLAADAIHLQEIELTAKVKTAYQDWLYRYAVLEELEKVAKAYQPFYGVAEIQQQLGEITLHEKNYREAQTATLQEKFISAWDAVMLAENYLRSLTLVTDSIQPPTRTLSLYQVEKTPSTGSFNAPTRIANYSNQLALKQEYELRANKSLWKRQKLLPQARIETRMAQNELERQKQLVEYEVEALLITLNQHFREIRLFQKYRLPEAQQAKNNAQHQLESDEISLQQYLIQLSNCSEIQLNYLKKIYEYNCMAILV